MLCTSCSVTVNTKDISEAFCMRFVSAELQGSWAVAGEENNREGGEVISWCWKSFLYVPSAIKF